MLQNTENIVFRSLQILYIFVLREENVTTFEDSFTVRNTNIYKMESLLVKTFGEEPPSRCLQWSGLQ